MWKKVWFFCLAFIMLISLEAGHPAIVQEEFIFKNPPFASCHAATLTQAPSGDLLCAWFAGTDEGENDVGIWQATLSEKKWSEPRLIASEKDVPCWNPVLFTLPSNEILLFYKAGEYPLVWSGLLKRSTDEGKNWSEAQDLPAGVLGPVKNRPLLLQDGTLVCGSALESWKRWGCWMDITSDAGLTWSKSTPINVENDLFGIIQPALFFTKDGTIKMLARSRQIGFICESESKDQGKTWTAARPTTLPNPNSAIDAINITDGRILLVYNNSKSPKERYPLNVALSSDGGKTWDMKVVLEDKFGEYSYPTVIQTKDGKIHIVYTWNRLHIKHVVVEPRLL